MQKSKPRTIAYIRVSTDEQDVNKQRLEILDYAHRNGMKINEFISIEISSQRTPKDRRIEEMMGKLRSDDTLIISELSRLGRSIPEVIGLVNSMVARKIRLIVIKQNLDIHDNHEMSSKVMVTVFSLLAELERDLISSRTKSALAAVKKTGKVLGRPKGRIGKSKLDGKEEEIRKLLSNRVALSAIARILDTARYNLCHFIKTRKIEVNPQPKRGRKRVTK
jgi:DNA invertase Pin-like site-specific DNA recombinase